MLQRKGETGTQTASSFPKRHGTRNSFLEMTTGLQVGSFTWGLCGVTSSREEMHHLRGAVSVWDSTHPRTKDIIG